MAGGLEVLAAIQVEARTIVTEALTQTAAS